MKKLITMCAVLGVLLMTAGPAMADSISPTSFSGSLLVGESVTIRKTVIVSEGTVKEGTGDVFFLSDTTGSMGGTIDSVQTNASAILSGLSIYGNIQTGAGNYQDFPTNSWGGISDHAYELDSTINGATATQTAINSWDAPLGWGDDWPESNLYALSQAAGASTDWRSDSEKFILWFGDAPGHELSNTSGYPGPSTAVTISTLKAAGVTVFAFNVGAIGGDMIGGLDGVGQATAITDATGGDLYNGFGTDIVKTIVDAIGAGFASYSEVSILAPSLPGLGITITPVSYMGAFERDVTREFEFDVTFKGLAPGIYDFDMYAAVDGGKVATEADYIEVVVPVPGALLLGMLGLSVAGIKLRKRT